MPRPFALLLARQQAACEELRDAHEAEVRDLRTEVARLKDELADARCQVTRRSSAASCSPAGRRSSRGSPTKAQRFSVAADPKELPQPAPVLVQPTADQSQQVAGAILPEPPKRSSKLGEDGASTVPLPDGCRPAKLGEDGASTVPLPDGCRPRSAGGEDGAPTARLPDGFRSSRRGEDGASLSPHPEASRRRSRLSVDSQAVSVTLPGSLQASVSREDVALPKRSTWCDEDGTQPDGCGSGSPVPVMTRCPTAKSIETEGSTPLVGGRTTSASAARRTHDKRKSSVASNLSRQGTMSLSQRHSVQLHTINLKQPLAAWAVWDQLADESDDEETRDPSKGRQNMIDTLRQHGKSTDFYRTDDSRHPVALMFQAMVMHPTSPLHIACLCVGMVMIVYDVIVVPMAVFQLEQLEDLAIVMSALVSSFWTVDFILNFFVGYYERGICEMRLRKTAAKYARTWMPMDLTLLIADWIAFAALSAQGTEKQGTSSARVVRSLRVMRTLRSVSLVKALIRFGRMPTTLKEFLSLVGRSQLSSMVMQIAKYMMGILLINHVISCLWVELGHMRWRSYGTKSGWVQYYMVDQAMHDGDDWKMLYMTSLHWSLSQFTPTKMEVDPRNLLERVFAVAVLIFAMLVFSSFLSSISTAMTQIRTLNMEETRNYMKLERFMQDNRISFYLSTRIRRYLDYFVQDQKKHPSEKSVVMLELLSEPLRMELHYEVYSPWLTKHPFFEAYAGANRTAFNRLCHRAVKTVCLTRDDVLYAKGDAAKHMYFVIRGTLIYTYNDDDTTRKIGPGEWACEMVLWTPWEYQGFMRASGDVHLIALDAAAFHECILDSKGARQQAAEYALKAVEYLNKHQESETLADCDGDAFHPADIVAEVFDMDRHVACSGTPSRSANLRAMRSLLSRESRDSLCLQ